MAEDRKMGGQIDGRKDVLADGWIDGRRIDR